MLGDINKVNTIINEYRSAGFIPFPLAPMQKIPPKGCTLDNVEHTCVFSANSNFGLFPGSENKLAVIDADSPKSKVFIMNKLDALGLLNWTTIISTPNKQGFHFWVKLDNVPAWAQAYYKLGEHVGDGEFRIHRPSYVVAPPSIVSAGNYKFVQGSIEFFNQQGCVDWKDMDWLVPAHILSARPIKTSDTPVKYVNHRQFIKYPNALKILESLSNAGKYDKIRRIDFKSGAQLKTFYPSRSEAEFNVVMSLVMSGWSFDGIYRAFEHFQPSHYTERPDPSEYLIRTYNKVVAILSR